MMAKKIICGYCKGEIIEGSKKCLHCGREFGRFKKMNNNKSFNWKLIIKLLFIGFFISIPLFGILIIPEKVICDNKPLDGQTDLYGIPLCNKLSEERVRTVWRSYCDEKKVMRSLREHEPCIRRILFFPFYPGIEKTHPDAGIVFFYIFPFYGALAGALIGLVVVLLMRLKKRETSIFRKWEFYLCVLIITIIFGSMIISVMQFISGSFDSFNKPFFKKNLCKIQGCEYREIKFCSDADIHYPELPVTESFKTDSYSEISIDQLPSETLYICETYQKKEVTRKELVNGTKCDWADNPKGRVYYDPFMHPIYGGYSVIENKIYYEYSEPGKIFCGYVGKIRYRGICDC